MPAPVPIIANPLRPEAPVASTARAEAARPSSPPGADECAHLRACLRRPLPEIPPRYFYDDRGSELFEAITGLPVYYQTRTEMAILERHAAEILALVRPRHLVELGSGAGRKIRLLLDTWGARQPRAGAPAHDRLCTMLDINAAFLQQSVQRLRADYPGCQFRGVVGDFTADLHRLELGAGQGGHRLIVFFAGTIGNLYPAERAAFLRALAGMMAPGDGLLIGVDLVKDRAELEAAYNDPEGITAAFNRNMLAVVNRRFDADFVPEAFAHRAFYDGDAAWIEMRLAALRPMAVRLGALDLTLSLDAGAEIRTEVSCKFTAASLRAAAAEAGLGLARWFTDPAQRFALALLTGSAS
jgi:L-histidine N-alpha-methyltransferase